ncbi:MAG: DUF167 domain-containing protein [Acidobacteria bacterium]|nr:DUF167 domain-containing protein [Acidobacteriota bacterium]
MLELRTVAGGCSFPVRLQPRAKRSGVAGEIGGALKIAVTAAPVEGNANAACLEILANLLNAPKSSFSIALGETSRNKVVRVKGMSAAEVRRRLTAAGVPA